MRLILIILTLLAAPWGQSTDALDIYIPTKCKTEGRITLIQPDANNQIVKHHLPFTETLDLDAHRSTISIGYVSYPPMKYYSRNNYLLTVDSNGKCLSHEDHFVSMLSWFVKMMFPPEVLDTIDAPLVGPTSLVQLLATLVKNPRTTQQKEATHRNIPCTVFEYQKVIANDMTLVVEFYLPTDIVFNSLKATFFSAKASTYNTADASELNSANKLRATFVVDYYFIDDASKDPQKFDLLTRSDFNVPLAAGCSTYLKALSPDVVGQQSFSMSYKQVSTISSHMLAYDHSSGLLRKEQIGGAASVWDLKEDLLYHVDLDISRSLASMGGSQLPTPEARICSVMKVVDEKLGPSFRPYDKVGEPIDVLKLIGATSVAYMGVGSVRDLSCSIYETILEEPPAIFALTAEQLQRQSSLKRKYIVQFYLLEMDRSQGATNDEKLPGTGFWPAQINLYRQFEDSGNAELIDQLEIHDFFWSLDGWTKKNNELFMASECFDDANKQVKLEMALTFDKIHSSPVDASGDKASADLRSILPYNKFKLEYDLIDDVFRNVFDVSKMHLVGYELKLRPNHVDMRMQIADRSEELELVYFGEGELASANAYEGNRISLAVQTEESCIEMSSLISEISMVIFCPFYQSHDASCTAVYNEPEPVFKNAISTDPLVPTCHVYRFKPAPLPKQALGEVISRKQQLYKRPFNFRARASPGAREDKLLELSGQIRDYELTHDIQLIAVDHHAFVLDPTIEGEKAPQLVRSFDTIDYRTPNDCERICNLDTHCRSYSYCKTDKKCILSSLDIRAADLQAQLIRLTPSEDAQTHKRTTKVSDALGQEFKVSPEDGCFIYERNYLSYYKQTEEVVSLDRGLAKQFNTAPSTFYCAKLSIDTEAGHADHHVAMFAYCESTNVCILDENLFDTKSNSSTAVVRQADREEMVCRIYRKRYQTYFGISSRVLKLDDPNEQLDLNFNTVEECARACWIKFGQVCASFDFCTSSPSGCRINKISANDLSDDSKLETKSGCLHYERDLELDKLRAEHMIGRHQVLDRDRQSSSGNSWARFAINMLTYVLAFGAFIYGLALGRKVNDKVEAAVLARQSASAAPGLSTTAFDYQSFPLEDEGAPISRGQSMRRPDVIKMDVIGGNN